MERDPPQFEEWRHYCFTQGYADFQRYSDDDGAQQRLDRFTGITAPLVAEFMARVFEGAGELGSWYTPAQLGSATWFLLGVGSGYLGDVCSAEVAPSQQIRVYRSMTRMYLDLYDKLCNREGTAEADCSDSDELDIAVYMIWDMGCVECAVMFPEKAPHLFEPGLAVLQTILDRCVTGSCLKSALHGLGHIESFHRDRVRSMISGFLNERGHRLPAWLVEYAEDAREGGIQ